MRRPLQSLMTICIVALIGYFAWTHRDKVPIPVVTPSSAADRPAESHVEYAEETQARGMTTITGPLADYMMHRQAETPEQADSTPRTPRPATEFDRVGDSPVGTSTPLLRKTFVLANAANLAFEIPAHASSPKLRGTYRSFIQHTGTKTSEEANVELLLLNEQQFSDLVHQQPGDAMFSAEGAPDQEISFTLPPTLNHPVKYYLVFRNDSGSAGKATVQSDFRIDY
ncbi:MAG TPA: hypothetical protein VMD99_17500 [Terriglobales bacterium]|nr:hypothetical protein [Terriglobales bacterium]